MTKPTNGELEILRILWDHGPSTVRFINDMLSTDKEVGYTTTLKLMQIMYEKGLLERSRDGKTHIYHALVSEEEAQRQLLDRFLDTTFQGSAMKLVMQALGSHRTTPEELDEIRRFIDDLENNQKKGG
ncbi:MAG: BlaI/MecI/CopY family transcriptional regulator [Bacteroidia bacterium]